MLQELQQHINEQLKDVIIASELVYDELTITVKSEAILDSLTFLQINTKCRFFAFIDISAVDYPQSKDRFQIVYHLLSPIHNIRIRVKIYTNSETPILSICSIFPGAEWYEREIYDMYGVLFEDHPDLRRILTDYGFIGHPLRKDFPVTGFVECRYDNELKKVIYEPVTLRQEMRDFDFLSPWVGEELTSVSEKLNEVEETV